MIDGVSTLPPGHTLRVNSTGEITTHRWSRLPEYAPIVDRSRGDLLETIRKKVTEAVRFRLVSDVPVASFLSGGLDSNVVTGLMAQMSAAPVKTFTLGFAGEGGASDERTVAQISARAFGTDHHELTITGDDVVRWLPDFFSSMDSPTGDGLNTYLVARATHEADPTLKVVLSGVGGDELFLGYKKFRWLAKHSNIQRLVAAVPRQVRGSLFRRLENSSNKIQNALRMLLEPSRTRILFSEEEIAALCSVDSLFVSKWRDTILTEGSLDTERNASAKLQRLDIENYLPNMLLRDLDVLTMSQSLEARAPFLDRSLMEFMQQVPLEEKAAGPSKSLLSEAFVELLPDEVLDKAKTGFELPMSQWLRDGALNPYLKLLQTGELRLINDGHLEVAAVKRTAERFLSGRAHYLTVWSIIALEGWYRALMQYDQLDLNK
jgi:asparagine synthase (glutamine-hydrolysing)